MQSFERRIRRRRFIRICTQVFQGEVHHRQQAIKIPAIKSDGSLARVRFDPSIKSERLGHVDGEALQFVKLVPGDESPPASHLLGPGFQLFATSRFTKIWIIEFLPVKPTTIVGGEQVKLLALAADAASEGRA